MKTNRRNYLAVLSLATASMLTTSTLVIVNAAEVPVPGTSGTGLGFGPGISPPPNGTPSHNGTSPAGGSPAIRSQPRLFLHLRDQRPVALSSAEGGDTVAQVVSAVQGKHLGTIKPEPIVIQFGPANGTKELYALLADTLAGKAAPTNGEIIAEANSQELSRLTFSKAIITEIQFPALEYGSRTPAVITVTFQPETTSRTFSKVESHAPPGPTAAEPVTFSLEIPTLLTSHAKNVPALIFKQTGTPDPMTRMTSPSLMVPNLVLTVPSTNAAPYETWFNDFVLQNDCGPTKEKQGSLRFLTLSHQEIFTLNLTHLGIVRLGLEAPQSPANLTRDCKVEIYCGGLPLSSGSKL